MTDTQKLLTDLARAKAVFQTRAILTAMGIDPEKVSSPPEEDVEIGKPGG